MNRFCDIDFSTKRLPPVYGYRSEKLVSIEQALEPIESDIDQLQYYIKIARKHCHFPSEYGLSKDESTAIYIYTMEWGETTLYRVLNKALRSENRSALKIWFPYLKLFDTALDKLPTVKEILWRGVNLDIGKNFIENQGVIWWSINSCSSSVAVIKNFLGNNKNATLFLIEAVHGKKISGYTAYESENEVILRMGTEFRVKSNALEHSGSHVVHLVEIDDNDDKTLTSATNEMDVTLTPANQGASRKSATGNSILHSRTAFQSIQSAQSITKDCEVKTTLYADDNGRQKQILVADTPGFFDTDENISNELIEKKIASQIFMLTAPGVHAFLIVLRIGRFSPEEKHTIEFIQKIFGKNAAKYCIIIFTHEDQLEEGQKVDTFISSSPTLQELVTTCGNRKFSLNNKLTGQFLERKTQQLLQMIQEMVNNNNGTYYTNIEYEKIEQKRKDEEQRLKDEQAAIKRAEEEKLKEQARREFEQQLRYLNQVKSTRTETQTVEISRVVEPITIKERTRKEHGIGKYFSHHGSGYDYQVIQIGSETTTKLREEQREIRTLNSGKEEFGDWRVIREWSTTIRS